MIQLDLTAPAPRQPEPPRQAARQPGSELREATRREVLGTLAVYARGRANAITGDRLAELVGLRLREVGVQHGLSHRTLQRRCQEAVAQLVEDGERIGSVSTAPAGYFIPESADEMKAAARGLRAHLASSARRLRAYDRATADQLLRLLGQEVLGLPPAAGLLPSEEP